MASGGSWDNEALNFEIELKILEVSNPPNGRGRNKNGGKK